jgi:hypothetical protein
MGEMNEHESIVFYGNADFMDICYQRFEQNVQFTVVCNYKSMEKCRKAVDAFLRHENPRHSGRWEHLKSVAKMGWFGMRTTSLMAICIRALILGWTITPLNKENEIIHLCPTCIVEFNGGDNE